MSTDTTVDDGTAEAEALIAERGLRSEPSFVARLFDQVREYKLAGDNASKAYHATVDGVRPTTPRGRATEAVVCRVFGIDQSAPGYVPVWKMGWAEAERASTADIPDLITYTASQIDKEILPPVDFVVPGIVAVGGTLLGARPKVGKTYMMIDFGYAVATGGKALGAIRCKQGAALLLLLEDNKARFQRRLRQIAGSAPKPEQLYVAFQENALRTDTGLLEQIRRWAKEATNPRLVVVDTLTAVRPVGLDKRGTFQVEYDIVRSLTDLAHELGVAIVVVHHLRKMKADGDPIDELSGTYGLAAAADTVAGLNKNGEGYALVGRGRDIEEFAYGLIRGDGKWTKVGTAEELAMSGERRRALAVLKEAHAPMTAAELAKATGQKLDSAKRMLDRMVRDGDGVDRPAPGRYRATPDQGEMAVTEAHRPTATTAEPF